MSYSDAYDPNDGVAIIGLAGRFPGARDVDEFWTNLVDGPRDPLVLRGRRARARSARRDGGAPTAQLRAVPRDPGRRRAVRRGVLRDQRRPRPRSSTRSSASSWRRRGRRWSPRATTPGPSPAADRRLRGHEQQLLLPPEPRWRAQDVTDIVGWLTTMMGNEKDYLATRVSYKLDLRGPALNIQTACSTSLVAVVHRGPEPAQLPVRPGARRRGLDHAAAEARVPPPGGRDHLARRPLPDVRRARRGHRLQQRRRDRHAQAAAATRSKTATRSTPSSRARG